MQTSRGRERGGRKQLSKRKGCIVSFKINFLWTFQILLSFSIDVSLLIYIPLSITKKKNSFLVPSFWKVIAVALSVQPWWATVKEPDSGALAGLTDAVAGASQPSKPDWVTVTASSPWGNNAAKNFIYREQTYYYEKKIEAKNVLFSFIHLRVFLCCAGLIVCAVCLGLVLWSLQLCAGSQGCFDSSEPFVVPRQFCDYNFVSLRNFNSVLMGIILTL